MAMEDISSLSSFSASDDDAMDTLAFENNAESEDEYFDKENKAVPTKDYKINFKGLNEDYSKTLSRMDNKKNQRPQSANGGTSSHQEVKKGTFGKDSTLRMNNRPLTSVRPQTAQNENIVERPKTSAGASFKPVYKMAYPQYLRETRQFNYKEKQFTTVLKKCDPVSRFNAFKNSWENTRFLKNNNVKGKEGRKLNLAERNQTGVFKMNIKATI